VINWIEVSFPLPIPTPQFVAVWMMIGAAALIAVVTNLYVVRGARRYTNPRLIGFLLMLVAWPVAVWIWAHKVLRGSA